MNISNLFSNIKKTSIWISTILLCYMIPNAFLNCLSYKSENKFVIGFINEVYVPLMVLLILFMTAISGIIWLIFELIDEEQFDELCSYIKQFLIIFLLFVIIVFICLKLGLVKCTLHNYYTFAIFKHICNKI